MLTTTEQIIEELRGLSRKSKTASEIRTLISAAERLEDLKDNLDELEKEQEKLLKTLDSLV